MGKRYYWLKIGDQFFDTKHIKVLQSMDNGNEYLVLWLKLLLSAIKDAQVTGKNFCLVFDEDIPYSPELISRAFGCSTETATQAIKAYEDLGMIVKEASGVMWARDAEKLVGSETDSAERVRKHREMLQCNNNVIKCNAIKRKRKRNINSKEKDTPEIPGTDGNNHKEIVKPVSVDNSLKKELRKKITDCFWEVNKPHMNFKREGVHITGLVEKALKEDEPIVWIGNILKVYWNLINEKKNKLFHEKPFLPSMVNSAGMFPHILAKYKSQKDNDLTEDQVKRINEIKF